jgi:hypothetical protein
MDGVGRSRNRRERPPQRRQHAAAKLAAR